jgi:hypothetical protein
MNRLKFIQLIGALIVLLGTLIWCSTLNLKINIEARNTVNTVFRGFILLVVVSTILAIVYMYFRKKLKEQNLPIVEY